MLEPGKEAHGLFRTIDGWQGEVEDLIKVATKLPSAHIALGEISFGVEPTGAWLPSATEKPARVFTQAPKVEQRLVRVARSPKSSGEFAPSSASTGLTLATAVGPSISLPEDCRGRRVQVLHWSGLGHRAAPSLPDGPSRPGRLPTKHRA